MFIVSPSFENISAAVMRFQQLWIFDLTAYHSFWKLQMQKEAFIKKWGVGKNPWEALMLFQGLHLFSPIEDLIPFARDFHQHRENPVNNKNIRDVFHAFRRLGLLKIGHLRRLPPAGIHKRFGKSWADFLKGVLDSQEKWIWEPFRKQDPLSWKADLDEPSTDALFILENLMSGFQKIADSSPESSIQKFQIALHLSHPQILEFNFPHSLNFKNDFGWIRKLIEEKLVHLCLEESVFRLRIDAFPVELKPLGQLVLFGNRPETLTTEKSRFQNFCRRLENQGYSVFKPHSLPSYIPEQSWERLSPLDEKAGCIENRGLIRPLIQKKPEAISAPEGLCKFTERITWFDEKGEEHRRDYFVTRKTRAWTWVFKDESENWFEQGIIE